MTTFGRNGGNRLEITIQQDFLASGLNSVQRAVSLRSTLPALTGILLTTGENSLDLMATDLEITIRRTLPATVRRPGSIVLPARYLAEIVRRIPGGPIHLVVNPENQTATLKWDRSEFTIHGFEAEQFPGLPDFGQTTRIPVEQGSLREVLRHTLFSVSQDETRPILTGVQILVETRGIRGISTDGFRISYFRGAGPDELAENVQVVIPGRSLNELVRLLGDGGEPAEIAVGESQVAFQLGDTLFIGRLLEGSYPAVLDLIPKEYPFRAHLNREEFRDSLERVALISDARDRANAVKLQFREDTLVLSANAPDVGRAYEEIPVDYQGDPLEVAFNAKYLLDGLRNIQDERVLFELSGPLSASRLLPAGDENFFYVVLPMRTA